MYEEQKMEYGRVKFNTELVGKVVIDDECKFKEGTILFRTENGHFSADASKGVEEGFAIAINDKKYEDDYADAIIFGEFDYNCLNQLNKATGSFVYYKESMPSPDYMNVNAFKQKCLIVFKKTI